MTTLNLAYGLNFSDLHEAEGLQKLDAAFLEQLDEGVKEQLLDLRRTGASATSDFLLELSHHVETFLGQLFGIENALKPAQDRAAAFQEKYAFKRRFVQRQAMKEYAKNIPYGPDFYDFTTEEQFIKDAQTQPDNLIKYAAWASLTPEGQHKHEQHVLFKHPQNVDFGNLVPGGKSVPRDGFSHTDRPPTAEQTLDQAHYCVKCHPRAKDYCSTGHPQGKNPLGEDLNGCPLKQKISEMNVLFENGLNIAALTVVTLDNPMVAATGQRICNECKRACIFQKQDAVDIPAIETQILKDVLNLPWGFEVYALLTKWNPLNIKRPFPARNTGKTVLVVGMGPAGFTLSHALLNDGHNVAAIDGLKIEPLEANLDKMAPIFNATDMMSNLEDRVISGFGGVAEYGITARWDKNYLFLIRVMLERRQHFKLFGGTRFGSQITKEQAMDYGVDHIALCAGSGKPNVPELKNNLAPGVRIASDFLMTLQLTGAYKKSSLANLQIRMPIAVIGAGLTAVDSATEALAYYPRQVEMFLDRLEQIPGAQQIIKSWPEEDQLIAHEFIRHAQAIRAERAKSLQENRQPDLKKLLDSWGGATIVYRKNRQAAPSYRLNHEELAKALEEGVPFKESLQPTDIVLDDFGHVKALACDGETLPARTVLIAAGTHPNLSVMDELKQHASDSIFVDGENNYVSYFGDLHEKYTGSVVKAMASAMDGAGLISKVLASRSENQKDVLHRLEQDLTARIRSVKRLNGNTLEVVVYAPAAARNFAPGQFFRLQNFDTFAPVVNHTKLAMEGVAMAGTRVDVERGLVTLIALEEGGSRRLIPYLKPAEPIVLMGPTGNPTEIVRNKTVVLIGSGVRTAMLASIAKALRDKGCRVVFFAAYKSNADIFDLDTTIKDVIWSFETIDATKPCPENFVEGTILDALDNHRYVLKADRWIVAGSESMLAAVNEKRKSLSCTGKAIASVNSPMQCMMKEICAQCLQKHIDPKTGEETLVFSCVNQDQPLETIDYDFLKGRLSQNAVSEKLTDLWVQKCLKDLNQKNLDAA